MKQTPSAMHQSSSVSNTTGSVAVHWTCPPFTDECSDRRVTLLAMDASGQQSTLVMSMIRPN